jgi:hypothetical protein
MAKVQGAIQLFLDDHLIIFVADFYGGDSPLPCVATVVARSHAAAGQMGNVPVIFSA